MLIAKVGGDDVHKAKKRKNYLCIKKGNIINAALFKLGILPVLELSLSWLATHL